MPTSGLGAGTEADGCVIMAESIFGAFDFFGGYYHGRLTYNF
jgi:ketopantoate hydroxymethyltransferase